MWWGSNVEHQYVWHHWGHESGGHGGWKRAEGQSYHVSYMSKWRVHMLDSLYFVCLHSMQYMYVYLYSDSIMLASFLPLSFPPSHTYTLPSVFGYIGTFVEWLIVNLDFEIAVPDQCVYPGDYYIWEPADEVQRSSHNYHQVLLCTAMPTLITSVPTVVTLFVHVLHLVHKCTRPCFMHAAAGSVGSVRRLTVKGAFSPPLLTCKVNIPEFACLRACVCACVRAYMCTYVCVCVHVYAHVCVHACVRTCVCALPVHFEGGGSDLSTFQMWHMWLSEHINQHTGTNEKNPGLL